MRAASIIAPSDLRIIDTLLPLPGPDQVRIRLEGCGVCASSLPLWQGRPWFRYPVEPGAPGHEGWGQIDAAGRAVSGIRFDRVAVLSYKAFAEFDVADARSVVSLPDELHDQLFPGEALGCAMNVLARSEIRSRDTVGIVGIGFLGAALTQLCARIGARVIALSRRQFALETAARCGASDIIPIDDRDRAISRIADLTDGRLCDHVIEAAGLQQTLDLASAIVCERGRFIIAGFHQDGPRQVDLQLWNWRGLDVINAHERNNDVRIEGMRNAVDAVMDGRIDLAKLGLRAFPIENLGDAFSACAGRPDGFLKAVITV
ncbi:MAG: zinc-binding dehydrogenase [Deltaproteobacteria bacterium]|nr:zinc-binding dehydrogenase [Deltaproteobacteria bacterium]MBV8453261.1 zinc-binding dehydrogenase [Deltaproteobacteria bacterium]